VVAGFLEEEVKTRDVLGCNTGGIVMSACFEADVEAPVMKHLIEDEIILAVKTRSRSENEGEVVYQH
jgi:hypothetical protein